MNCRDRANYVLSNTANTPMSSGYRPELDITPYLNDDQANWYHNMIGVLRWAIELGRIDIHVEVSMLASFLVQPREINAYIYLHT
jgi:hypothetical protein